jgi:hypothetical protein
MSEQKKTDLDIAYAVEFFPSGSFGNVVILRAMFHTKKEAEEALDSYLTFERSGIGTNNPPGRFLAIKDALGIIQLKVGDFGTARILDRNANTDDRLDMDTQIRNRLPAPTPKEQPWEGE